MNLPWTDYLAHLSNILLLVSYSVRDILWLRWFAVAAAFIVMPYYLFQPAILWPPVFWGAVFALINLYRIWCIYRERRPVVLSDEEQKLYDMGFRTLTPREFLSFVMAGKWADAAAGDKILSIGEPVVSICIPVSGTVRFHSRDRDIGDLAPGHAIGTALALLGEKSSLDATFTGPARCISWRLSDVRAFLEKRPELRNALQALVNQDLARKIQELTSLQFSDRAREPPQPDRH